MTVEGLKVRIDERRQSSNTPAQPFPSSWLQEFLRFFFKPLHFHLELSNLPIKLSLQLIPVPFRMLAPVGKNTRQHLQNMTAPLTDLVGMDAKLAGNLSHRLLPLDGFQSNLGLKCSIMMSAHVDHFTIPPLKLWQVKMHLIALSSFWGEAHPLIGNG